MNRLIRRSAPAFALACAAAGSLSGCAAQDVTTYGDELALGNSSVKTFVTSEDGEAIEIGFVIPAKALEGLPEPEPGAEAGPPLASQALRFPKDAPKTAIDHATFDFMPSGHIPAGVFDKPHFDVHFYLATTDQVSAVLPSNPNFLAEAEKAPEAKYMPANYGLGPVPVAEVTVPLMGVHTFDMSQPPIPGQFKFTETLLNGTWNGQYTFIEPMMTKEFLLSKPDVEKDLKLPQAYQKSAAYPTKYSIRYNEDRNEYTVALSGFEDRTKS